jgi:hypothetical protein
VQSHLVFLEQLFTTALVTPPFPVGKNIFFLLGHTEKIQLQLLKFAFKMKKSGFAPPAEHKTRGLISTNRVGKDRGRVRKRRGRE